MPPKYNTVTLPAKVVTTRLAPIGPPATPSQLPIPTPPVQSAALSPPVHTSITLPQPVQSVAVPTTTIVQSVPVPVPAPIQSVAVPTQSVVKSITVPTAVPVVAPQYRTTSVPIQYATSSFRPLTTAYGTRSVGVVGNPVYRTASNPIIGSQVIPNF